MLKNFLLPWGLECAEIEEDFKVQTPLPRRPVMLSYLHVLSFLCRPDLVIPHCQCTTHPHHQEIQQQQLTFQGVSRFYQLFTESSWYITSSVLETICFMVTYSWGAFNCCFLPDDWKTPLDNLFQNSISNMLPEDGVFSNSDCFPCWSVCRRTMYLVIIPPRPFPSRLKWFKLASCWNAALKLAHYRHCNCSAWLILLCSLSHWCTFCPTVRTCEGMLESTLKRSSPIATIHNSKRLKAAKMNECGFSCGYGACGYDLS